MSTTSIYTRYFVYSKTQMQEKKNIQKGLSSSSVGVGKVIVNGVPRDYTDIVTDMKKCRYGDSVLVYKGDIRKVKYTIG